MQTTQPNSDFQSHIKASIRLGLPLIGAQLAQMLITVVDTIMLGWLGVKELAAGTLAGQIFFIFLIFGLGIGAAIIPLVAGALGREEPREVRRSARMGLWMLLGVSTFFMIPLWFTEEILVLLGQKPELAALAGKYMAIAQWSLIPAFLLIGLRSFLTGLEQAQIVMWFTILTAILNAILNYALIFGNLGAPRLEMEGAAIATLIANCFAVAITAIFVWRSTHTKSFEVFTRLWRPDWQAFNQIGRLGFPISLTILAEAGLFSAVTVMIGWLGTVQLAAHGVALQIASITFMIPLGLSQVASVRVGKAVGRNDAAAIGRAGNAVFLLALAISFLSAIVLILVPKPLIQFFLDANNPNAPDVLAFAVGLLFMAAVFQLVDGIQVVAAGALRGLSDTKIPLLIAIISYWPIGLSTGYFLGIYLGYGGMGIWAGLVAGLTCSAVLLVHRFWNRDRLNLLKTT